MLRAETLSKTVTPAQMKFLRLLNDCGPMTANELSGRMGKSVQYAHQVMRELRKEGIIEKTLEGTNEDMGTLAWRYKLSVLIDSLNIKARRTSPRRIPGEEVRYAAILRNAPPECRMTGRELQDQFRMVYPDSSRRSILRIISRARRNGWCR